MPHWLSEPSAANQRISHRAERASNIERSEQARCPGSSKYNLGRAAIAQLPAPRFREMLERACSARQQIVDVDDARRGEKDPHGTQDDGQDQVEQKGAERNEEAELEGCACADPDLVRCCDAVGVAHVPTLPSRPQRGRRAAPTGRSFVSGRWRSGGFVWAARPCGSAPTAPNDRDLCEGWLSRGPWWAGCWPAGSVH
jgi:hypothetical protein